MNSSSPLSRLSPAALLTLLLVIIIATFACGLPQSQIPVTGTGEPDTFEEPTLVEEQPAQEIPSLDSERIFRTDRTSLSTGECAILEWDVKGVEVVQLNESPVSRASFREVCPLTTTSYTLRGFSGGGPPVFEKVIEINVVGEQQSQPTQAQEHPMNTFTAPKNAPAATAIPAAKSCPGKPVISYFNANPTTIDAGQTSVLSWDTTTNSPAGSVGNVSINNGVGNNVGAKGDETVKPGKTTTYSLTAGGCGGSVTRTVTVTVNVPPAAPPGGGSAGVLTADLAITDLYPESWPNGTIFARITNNGPGSPSKSEVQIACEASAHPYDFSPVFPVSTRDALYISQAPGQTTAYSTGIVTQGTLNWYDVSCTIKVPFNDPNSGNNTYSEKFPTP